MDMGVWPGKKNITAVIISSIVSVGIQTGFKDFYLLEFCLSLFFFKKKIRKIQKKKIKTSAEISLFSAKPVLLGGRVKISNR